MKKNVGVIVLVVILIIAILVTGGLLVYKILTDKKQTVNNEVPPEEVEIVELEPEKEVQIYAGNDRPIAVMIDNHKSAWPHANINEAYMVYEIIVEGAETPLVDFFEEFVEFLADVDDNDDFTLWCLQLDFDVAMIRSMYSWYNLNAHGCDEEVLPWNFRKVRDVRPYMDALDHAGLLPPKVAGRHTPLADCLAQINYVHLAIENNLVIR